MKNFLVTLLCIAGLTSYAQEQTTTLVVSTDNVLSDKGTVKYALYDREGFMKKPLQAAQSKIDSGKAKVFFNNLKPGTYAVIAYHDANDNNQIDFGPDGMPLESYGTSNNRMSMGPPEWSDAQFALGSEPMQLLIRF